MVLILRLHTLWSHNVYYGLTLLVLIRDHTEYYSDITFTSYTLLHQTMQLYMHS